MKPSIATEPAVHRIANMPALRLAGLSRRYPATPQAMRELGAQWRDFAHGAGARLLASGPVMYGVHIGLFDTNEDRYFSGIEIGPNEEIPAGLAEMRLGAITCAVIDHAGDAGEISQTISQFLREGIRHSGHRLTKDRPFDLIERYGKNFDPMKARGDIQLVIPVEA
jgi:predicted transcriptional regulator YdeE